VTDADPVLGYLDPDNYAGGHIKRDKKRSVFAIDENLSDELGLSTIAAAKVIESTVGVASSAADSRSQSATRCGTSCSLCRPGPYR